MILYDYIEPTSMSRFLGSTPQQIQDTLRYYKYERGKDRVKIPSLDQIPIMTDAMIVATTSVSSGHQRIEISLTEGLVMAVNASAYTDVVMFPYKTAGNLRGSLYKFAVPTEISQWFISQEVVDLIQSYDWRQHQAQMEQWIDQLHRGKPGLFPTLPQPQPTLN